MSDQIAHTPLNGPTTYDFGEATPKEWPQGEYVPKAVYDAALASYVTSIEVEQRRTERWHARVQQLSAAIDQLFSLVQEKGEPLSSPANQALINAGDTISVNEGNLWNLRWVLMAHSPSPAGSPSRPDNLSTGSALSDGTEHAR